MMLHVEQNRIRVTTADYPASSGQSYAPIQSLTEKEETSSEYFTRKILAESETALSSGSRSIEPGSRRAAWQAGIKEGYLRTFQSPILETLMSELSLLRKLVSAMTEAAHKQDRMISSLNRMKNDAHLRVIQLARKLDELAPGWDKK
jgi:hypothetical protein